MSGGLTVALAAIAGAALGVGIMALLRARQRRLLGEQAAQVMADRAREEASLLERLKTEFDALSRKALSENADDFLKLAKTALREQTSRGNELLDAKKKLIDARLVEMNAKLTALNKLIEQVDKQRAESHGALTAQLQSNAKATHNLQTTTS